MPGSNLTQSAQPFVWRRNATSLALHRFEQYQRRLGDAAFRVAECVVYVLECEPFTVYTADAERAALGIGIWKEVGFCR